MPLAQEGPPVLGLRAKTLAIRENCTRPMRGPQPMQSAGRSSTQLQTREPKEGSGRDGRELKSLHVLRPTCRWMSQVSGSQAEVTTSQHRTTWFALSPARDLSPTVATQPNR